MFVTTSRQYGFKLEDYIIIPSIKGDLHKGCWQTKNQIQSDLVFYMKKTSNFKLLRSSNFEIMTDMADDLEENQTGLEITKRMQKFSQLQGVQVKPL